MASSNWKARRITRRGGLEGEGFLDETDEMELAAQFLEIQDEAELDQFIGNLIDRVRKGARKFFRSPLGQQLGKLLKGAAKKILPVAGAAVGGVFGGPAGAAIGGKLASGAGKALGLELEGLSPEDKEFEVARQYVRFANAAIQNARRGCGRSTGRAPGGHGKDGDGRRGAPARARAAEAWRRRPDAAGHANVGPVDPAGQSNSVARGLSHAGNRGTADARVRVPGIADEARPARAVRGDRSDGGCGRALGSCALCGGPVSVGGEPARTETGGGSTSYSSEARTDEVSEEDQARRFVFLRMRFNGLLADLDTFGDVLTQRSQTNNGVWLAGLDVAAADGLAVPGLDEQPPPVMCYLDRGHGAAIRRARTRLVTGENPVAIVRIPRERMVGGGIGSSLLHEVGHQAAAMLDLLPSLRARVAGQATAGRRGTAGVADVGACGSRRLPRIFGP